MQLTLTAEDCARLHPETLAQVFRELGFNAPLRLPSHAAAKPEHQWTEEWDFRNVADLTVPQIREFVHGYEQIERALRIFAEHGPILEAKLLAAAGVVDDPTGEERGWEGVTAISSFQRAMTKRTRTVTGDKKAYLFTWGEWEFDDEGHLIAGKYVISPVTHEALRKYFGLDD